MTIIKIIGKSRRSYWKANKVKIAFVFFHLHNLHFSSISSTSVNMPLAEELEEAQEGNHFRLPLLPLSLTTTIIITPLPLK